MADVDVKQQIVDKIKDSNSILVTVNSNPSVDELSAALGITLLINKLDKHATCVFSGEIPSAISFLNPEKTFESTVDSLRDFIIALDKEKADHLRYKVDGDVVKIFITPYRTVINQDDLDFSQGDYNVEFVLAIGVQREEELDRALASHGRILHDASVASVNLGGNKTLGDIRWIDSTASSYSELLAQLGLALRDNKGLFDEQISTAFLTGIVAATERFSNAATTSDVMTLAARLMSTGANQQLIAAKLEYAEEKKEEISFSRKDTTPPRDARSSDLKENITTKVPRDALPALKPVKKQPANDGSLVISHELKGDVDEVAEQVARRRQEEAADRAEDALAARLAQNVPVAPPALSLLEMTPPPAPKAAPVLPTPQLRGAMSSDQWISDDDQANEPSMGGTLNATTEQAAADKRRELLDERNHTILSHDGDAYLNEKPSYQAPLNATGVDNEPQVEDIFNGDPQPAPSLHASMIQPPVPATPAPTLAEIDAQNRAKHDDAMSAINAAFEETPLPPLEPSQPTAAFSVPATPTNPASPSLPPLPPMPDFSTLPPLPPSMPSTSFGPAPTSQPFEPTYEPTAPAPQAPLPGSSDPTQFRIPGQ